MLANDGKALREIADKIVELARTGDIQAIREAGDRIEGKPIQALEHSGSVALNIAKAESDVV